MSGIIVVAALLPMVTVTIMVFADWFSDTETFKAIDHKLAEFIRGKRK